ncbi:hypothetical protein T23_03190 [Turicibacter faecis]|uniref:Uncharacterized protein n=1 Tax=Turicibacter faecis TaxID=2963365 RepID=A0ABM8IG36_9FIRM|nr:hypothetical protein T23_03190 [Turicibacter sp. TC023]
MILNQPLALRQGMFRGLGKEQFPCTVLDVLLTLSSEMIMTKHSQKESNYHIS